MNPGHYINISLRARIAQVLNEQLKGIEVPGAHPITFKSSMTCAFAETILLMQIRDTNKKWHQTKDS